MKQFGVLKLFCICLGYVAGGYLQAQKSNRTKTGDRPKIISILSDDQCWDAIGYAGKKLINTPEMGKLANEGTYFKNAIITTPICAASRASILTGFTNVPTGSISRSGT